jgi:hypothetical protein
MPLILGLIAVIKPKPSKEKVISSEKNTSQDPAEILRVDRSITSMIG